MNYVPQINRRAFVVSAAAFGGGLALGMDIPFGPTVVRAADGSPEVTAWVVIKPDDGVVIRIARSEMGQGSMTGLAQLSDARPEPRAQPRMGQAVHGRKPRHPRVARVCAQGRRDRAHHADPGGGQ